ncbi:MAG: flagellar biosynthetic protein FliO [Gammaproteobacteria bacterium]|nr:flagellar biosynthetic protein FliO [Gammaproteobacteria bacterium]
MRALTTIYLFLITQVSFATVAVETVNKKPIPSLTSEPVGLGNFMQMFFGLFIVVGLIVGMAWFMRRIGNMGGMNTGDLKVVGGVSVGQRERIVLVQAGDTQLLVGVGPGTIRTLHVMEEPIATKNPGTTASSGFAEKLHTAIKNRGNT